MEVISFNKLSDEELLREGLGHISEGSAFLFEIESEVGKALAFMVDNLLRYGESVIKGEDPREYGLSFDCCEEDIDEGKTQFPNCS